jgi:catechol 2,3-dioxygenase-like lactoylglutathione lyase family enzyme
MAFVHHFGIAVVDLEDSIRFWREGLGFEVILDEHYERDWQRLLGSPCTNVHIVALASPQYPATCAVELIKFTDDVERPRPAGPPIGVSHLSVVIDDDEVFERLATLGYSSFEEDANEVDGMEFRLWFFRGPDGVIVELAKLVT